jgi:two-component system response regulator
VTETVLPVRILLVEDNLGDIELTREALRISKIANQLTVVQDGKSALETIETADRAGRLPDLVLLDLNLPGMNGSEVLARVKNTPRWSRIPIVILTSSQAEADIIKSYELHANCYVTKPLDFSQFIHVVRSIEDFWFTLVRLPRRDS